MTIHVLPEDVITKIAAGEVISRPASIVKELIENSLDAKATSITIHVREGGISFISVADNGIGMSKEDVEQCIIRHATSKISEADDLFSLHTLGFRGEALASIAMVAKTTIVSRTNEFIEGHRLIVQGGEVLSFSPVGTPLGTFISVENLFFNQPVRKQYLQSIALEYSAIHDVVLEYAIMYPEFFFALHHHEKSTLLSPPSDELSNIVHLYGKEIVKQLIPLQSSYEEVIVQGFISKPYYTRADKSQIHIFINGRAIVSKVVMTALLETYHRLLHGNRYPFAVIKITIDPSSIDVNVHPQKREVMLRSEQQVFNAVKIAVSKAFQEHDVIPTAPLLEGKVVQELLFPKAASMFVTQERQQLLSTCETSVRILGISCRCYILAEDNEGLVVIDQHAADERVNYDLLQKQFSTQGIVIQQLLSPLTISLSSSDESFVLSHIGEFQKFGFTLQEFGSKTIVLRSIPVLLQSIDGEKIFYDVLDELRTGERTLFNIQDKVLARIACRMSIMKGDLLELSDAAILVRKLLNTDSPFACAHGRPTMIRLTDADFEQKFKRCGAEYGRESD